MVSWTPEGRIGPCRDTFSASPTASAAKTMRMPSNCRMIEQHGKKPLRPVASCSKTRTANSKPNQEWRMDVNDENQELIFSLMLIPEVYKKLDL